jgi:hypothetical protein
MAPIIPGLNDADIPKVLKRAAECGATFAFYAILRLPGSVKDVFMTRLHRDFPERAGKVEHHLRETRGGELYQNDWGRRMTGEGKMAAMIADLFKLHARKNGLNGSRRGFHAHRIHRPCDPGTSGKGRESGKARESPKTPNSDGFIQCHVIHKNTGGFLFHGVH